MDGLLWFLIIGGLFYVMMRYGCGAHRVHGHGAHEVHKRDGGPAGNGSGGSEQIDPVCGMTVAADQGYGKMHGGTLYRFCSRSCLDKFEAEPDAYLKPASARMGGAS